MNTRLAKVKREIGEDMARKAAKNKQPRKTNLPSEGVITEEMMTNEETTELVNQEARPDNEVIDNLEAENAAENVREPTDVVIEDSRPSNEGIENMEAENDAETVKGHMDFLGPKQVDQPRDTLEKDTRTIKPSRKKTNVGKKAARGIIIREPVVGNDKGATGTSTKDISNDAVEQGAKTKADVPDKGKKVADVAEIGRVGKRRKCEVGITKEKKPKRTKNVRGESFTMEQNTDDAEPHAYPTMKTRKAGYALIRVFKRLSTEQRKTVESMGFGGLLDFNVAETPSTLGYWLLENFDPMACVIKLHDGRDLRVEVDDVTHVLGLPNGRTIIKRKAKNLPHPVVTEFKSLFTNHSPNITAYLAGDELLTRDADSIWFKQRVWSSSAVMGT
ncbi:hypothetical protein CASFOL_000530 [Castilleja foliolosa]|uniref:Uncharacterized protein n=1 Tax=Castilleja foliolosa TaxID=1961234 RepID=A0ABD3ESY7_9LAMI